MVHHLTYLGGSPDWSSCLFLYQKRYIQNSPITLIVTFIHSKHTLQSRTRLDAVVQSNSLAIFFKVVALRLLSFSFGYIHTDCQNIFPLHLSTALARVKYPRGGFLRLR